MVASNFKCLKMRQRLAWLRLLLVYMSKMSSTVSHLVLQVLRSLYISDSWMSEVRKLLDWDA